MHWGTQVHIQTIHSINNSSILPSWLSCSHRQSFRRDFDFPIIWQTNELDFNSITRANLSQLPPDLRRKWAHSLWMVCALCCVLQRNLLSSLKGHFPQAKGREGTCLPGKGHVSRETAEYFLLAPPSTSPVGSSILSGHSLAVWKIQPAALSPWAALQQLQPHTSSVDCLRVISGENRSTDWL